MASDDLIPMEGEIVNVLGNGYFTIKVMRPDKDGTEKEHLVTARLGGKINKFKIRIVLGDRVTVEVTPYDLSKGRITYRHK